MARRPVASVVLALAAAAPLVAAPAPALAADFAQGVAAGEVTATSAVLWTRAATPGPVLLRIWPLAAPTRVTAERRLRATRARDLTVQVRVGGLRPDTRYRYRFSVPGAQATGRFRTAPRPASTRTVRFAWSGDADAQAAPGTTRPFYNRFEVYARMAAERNDFNVNLGDTIYSDSEVPGVRPARTTAAKWAKYRQNLALPALRALRSTAGFYSHWDDHELINDFSRAERGAGVYRAGLRAFRDYSPVSYSRATGLFRSVRWGRNLELFFLDERSFRSAPATAGGACANPARSGTPDPAPTAPATLRSPFSLFWSPLRNPVPVGCLARLNDPRRTMLGARQYRALTRALAASRATFKVIVNEVPLLQLYTLPYDRWEGYAAERTRLLTFLRDRIRNVVVLTTDTHANLVGEVRLATLEPGGPVGTGVTEVVTGPVATMTFGREIARVIGRPDAGRLLADLFLQPPPPAGIGLRCAALDVYSYGEVVVGPRRLVVRLKDARGRPVRNDDGRPCAPVVVNAR